MKHWERHADLLVVPGIGFGGIGLEVVFPDLHVLGSTGAWGCVLASFVLAYIAYQKPRKDIVSLLTPLYAVLIFANPDFSQERLIQILFTASLTVLILRLKWRFSSDGKGDRIQPPKNSAGEMDDEELPDSVYPENPE